MGTKHTVKTGHGGGRRMGGGGEGGSGVDKICWLLKNRVLRFKKNDL